MTEQVREDPVLGKLTFDKEMNWYAGAVKLGKRDVAVRISLDECDDVEALIPSAAKWMADLGKHEPAARTFAANRLLELKNSTWREEGEKPHTGAAFAAKLGITSVQFSADGDAKLFFADGGLFWGHTIIVSWSAKKGFKEAQIAG
jgi:hypothetical protein